MTRLILTLLGVTLLLTGGPVRDAQATRRFAMIIGNNVGGDATQPLRWAESDARKMAEVLTTAGGFATDDTVLLLGADAARVTSELDGLLRRVASARERTLLLIYYSGHADGDQLELGTTGLPFSTVRRALTRGPGDLRIGIIDACHSGAMVAHKGTRRGRRVDVEHAAPEQARGYAILTSSSHSELSQESAAIRGAYFTHHLVSGLRGAADDGNDGTVSLAEAYQYAYRRTVAQTGAVVGGGQTPMYALNLSGHGDVPLTRLSRPGARVSARGRAGRILVLDGRGEVLVTELTADNQRSAALAPGRYQAWWISADEVRQGQLTLGRGQHAVVRWDDLQPAQMTTAQARGGVFTGHRTIPIQLSAGLSSRRVPLTGGGISLGPVLRLAVEPLDAFEVSVALGWATSPRPDATTDYQDAGAWLGLAWTPRIGRLQMQLGGRLGYEHLFQAGDRHTSAGAYHAVLGLQFLFTQHWLVGVQGLIGARVLQVDEAIAHRLDGGGELYLGYRWH